ncbi:hypothetical protein BAY60_00645 [Prauserella muralis]|uniref:Uncharacterized protein n=2 Tax=Prauserella muralis TaxID=588067 RepID=A0A2V4BJT4_9PSEU|nr:hypothetical protein BAY60_00645 [Prauserella muralis]TWE14765.1 hypothetical protein FHX69_6924 [Prauserella muralis]
MGRMENAVRDKSPARGRTPALMRVGIALFAVGMLAVVAVFVMFAAGLSDLPVWLSVVAGVVTPLGLGLGLISLVREHRRG